ncbi:MAG: hypothetical protein ABI178_10670 [Rhodanobacter sp.]
MSGWRLPDFSMFAPRSIGSALEAVEGGDRRIPGFAAVTRQAALRLGGRDFGTTLTATMARGC